MDDQVILRPVTEDDLKLLERLLTEPGATGDEWHGWQDTRWLRRRWDENGLLGEDRGILMAACEDNAIGFVSWGETKTRYQSSCWMIGISLAPQARGHGYGTEATRQLARYDDVLYSLLRHEVDLR